MKIFSLIYWILTILIVLLFCMSGFMALQASDEYMAGMRKMGYPDYFPTIHGVMKFMGAAALLIPRRYSFKHWAYAGLAFTLVFAAAAHAFVGEPYFVQVGALVILLISYYIYETKLDMPKLL